MYRRLSLLVGIAAVTLFFASTHWADVPAPPANQTIGMPDIAIGDLTEADCRVCHTTGVPDRHHLLYGQPIPPGSLVPYPDSDGDTIPDTVYGCLNCHDENFTVVRDCIVCHTSSAHHTTPAATGGDCESCHGDLVDTIGDGHYIPTYDPSLVTPGRSQGAGLPLNSRGTGAGGCDYCHDNDGLPTPVILTNQELHHGASDNCSWCHDFGAPFEEQIRTCEGCHGPDSLHNIQADSPAVANVGTIVVGGEDAGYGHVGRDQGPSDSDCWGCHGFPVGGKSAGAPSTSAIIPTIYSDDPSVIDAGADTVVTLSGSAFTNTTDGTKYSSVVVLTAADGSAVTLTPDAIQEGSLTVTIPGSTVAGNCDLQAVKTDSAGDPVASNPVSISIRPQVVITDVSFDGTTLTITGSGFSGYAAGSGTYVSAKGLGTATIVSWNDTTIVAELGSSPEEVTVSSVFGSATAEVSGSGSDTWRVNVPMLGSEFWVTFEQLQGFLVVQTSYAGGQPGGISLGMEFGNVIFWMDITGTIYFGNLNRGAGTASGIVMGHGGGSSVWYAEQTE